MISIFLEMLTSYQNKYKSDFTFGNVKDIYNTYNNFHGIHQTLAESKTGTFMHII